VSRKKVECGVSFQPQICTDERRSGQGNGGNAWKRGAAGVVIGGLLVGGLVDVAGEQLLWRKQMRLTAGSDWLNGGCSWLMPGCWWRRVRVAEAFLLDRRALDV